MQKEATQTQQALPQPLFSEYQATIPDDDTIFQQTYADKLGTAEVQSLGETTNFPFSFTRRSDMGEEREAIVLGNFAAIPFGYMIILIVLIEGLVALHDFLANPKSHIFFDTHAIADAPFKVILGILGVADIFFGLAGALALWLLWPQLLTPLCCWRFIATVVLTPVLAVRLALEPPIFSLLAIFTWTTVYLAIHLCFLYVLSQVYQAVDLSSQFQQEEAQEQAAAARLALLRRCRGAPLPAEVPRVFGLLPLEASIAFYMLITVVLSAWGLVVLIDAGHGTGAWAFVATSQKGRMTFWLEVLLFASGLCSGTVGLMALFGHRDARGNEEYLMAFGFQGTPEFRELSRAKKRGALGVLSYFVFSILRFSLFVPVTGMALMMADVCGMYVHGISNLSQVWAWPRAAPMHCSGFDLFTLLLTLNFCLLDAYLLLMTYKLWDHYQAANAGTSSGAKRAAGARLLSGTVGQYGALDVRPVPSTLQPLGLSYSAGLGQRQPTFGSFDPNLKPVTSTLQPVDVFL